jgi:tRNA/tmRNA/rRNA uracil-C5-methylase (TrmA/RlmC/RlmD family)
VAPAYQLQWKARVLRDQLARIGRFDAIGGRPLDEVPEQVTARPLLGWRTRFAIDTNASGQACFHAPQSSELIPVEHCPMVTDSLQTAFTHNWPAGVRVHVSESQGGPTVAPLTDGATESRGGDASVPSGWRMAPTVVRTAAGRPWRVAVDGFWQAHVDAADTLVAAVQRAVASGGDGGLPGSDGLEGGGSTTVGGARALVDLYSGVGLFAGALAVGVSPAGAGFDQVTAVEGDPKAVRLARRNLHDVPTVRLVHADVKEWVGSVVGRQVLAQATAVVLDPPRAGAGPAVIDAVAASGAAVLCYVACDGASLARDGRRLVDSGWRFEALEVFNLFGMSGHIEAVARFIRV